MNVIAVLEMKWNGKSGDEGASVTAANKCHVPRNLELYITEFLSWFPHELPKCRYK